MPIEDSVTHFIDSLLCRIAVLYVNSPKKKKYHSNKYHQSVGLNVVHRLVPVGTESTTIP